MKKLLLATLLSCLSFANPAKASVTSWVRSLSQSVIKATWDRQAALISIFRPRRPMGFHILSRRISFHFTGRARPQRLRQFYWPRERRKCGFSGRWL